ncbi:hypothetical protein [Legionella sp. WA2024007413]
MVELHRPCGSILPGKKKTCEPGLLLEPLKKIWLATDQLCGKPTKEALSIWLPHYHKHHESSLDELSAQLLTMSATIEFR